MLRMMNEKGFSLLELVIASAVSAAVGVASMTAMRNLADANKRVSTLNDARAENHAMLMMIKKHYDARLIPDPTRGEANNFDIDDSVDTNPKAPDIPGCGPLPTPCKNITFRQRSRDPLRVQTAAFEFGCEAWNGDPINYSSIPALPGKFSDPPLSSCVPAERPFVRFTLTSFEPGDPTPVVTNINFPRGHIGAFVCARRCNGVLSVEAATIYQRTNQDLGVVSERLSLSLNRNTAIQILPP